MCPKRAIRQTPVAAERNRIGRYLLLERLGAGGMGVAWKAYDPDTDQLVVVKTMRSDEEELRLRFAQEADLLIRLEHDNIVKVYEHAEERGRPYIVMELVVGASLSRVLPRARGGIPHGPAVSIMRQIAAGLAYIHECGVIHRDISAHNVMITRQGRVKLIDFGIAKASTGPALTQPGQVFGKVGYMAPEQIMGEEADARADVFSAGVVFYELTTGRRPFGTPKGRSEEVMRDMLNGAFAPPQSRGVDGALGKLISRSMSTERDERPRDGAALLDKLLEIPTEATHADLVEAVAVADPTAVSDAEAERTRLHELARTQSMPTVDPPKPRPAPQARPDSMAVRIVESVPPNRTFPIVLGLIFVAGVIGAYALSTSDDAEPPPRPIRPIAALPSEPDPARARPPAKELYRKGTDALMRGELHRAERFLTECMEAEPTHALCARSLGVLYAQLDEPQLSRRFYRMYVKLAPDAPDAARVRDLLRD